MSRSRLVAIAFLAVVAVASGVVALVIGSGSSSGSGGSDLAAPAALATPTDVTAGVAPDPAIRITTGEHVQVDSAGREVRRTFLVLAPRVVDPSIPLVIGLHGRNATPGEEASRDELVPYVAAGQAVLVYPVGYQQAWNTGDGCCGLAVAYGLDDVAFVGEIADAVRAQYALTGPTDLVGFSNGGRLAYAIACRDAARYDAIATVSASPTTPDCPQADVPVPLFAGFVLDDPELPTNDDPEPTTQVLADLESTWVERDQCLGKPTTAVAGEATVRNWTACAEGSVLETASWPTGGHSWPQAVDVGAPDATDLVWSFLSGVHSRADPAGD